LVRHRFWIVLAMLTVGSMLAAGRARAGDNAADLAAQLNAQWAPRPPAYSAESVGQQRGPEKFGGWGGVRIGNLLAQSLARTMLAAPNNTLTPEQALALATQQVMDARQDQDRRGRGWGRLSQDLTGQKLGDVMKSAQSAPVTGTGQSPNAKGVEKPAGKAAGKTEQELSNAFDKPAHSAGVAVTGPGASGGRGRGHDKDGAAGKDVADKGGGFGSEGSGGGSGHGGGKGGGRGGGEGPGGGSGGSGGGGKGK
jgi:hypothetical protein